MLDALRIGATLLALALFPLIPARAQDQPVDTVAGRIVGVVTDARSGAPIAGATVEIVGRPGVTPTGKDGRFAIDAPPGSHRVRASAASYQGGTPQTVQVVSGQDAAATLRLAALTGGGIVVNVIGRIRRAAESMQLARRKAAAAVSETISAETMKKSAGSDATAAVQRATGVTIREGGSGSKTVFVRGLGDRYTSALLNGSRLPSPDALRRVVPLDLFPSDFLEGIDIIKGFTPDLPGDFAGGLVDMRLRDYPDALTYSYGVSTGGNTQSTGQRFLTYDGAGAEDYFGLGEGFRNPPGNTPAFDANLLPNGQRFALGRSFRNIWKIKTSDAPPDWGANAQIGNTFETWGFQLGSLYNVRFRTVNDEVKRLFTSTGGDNPEAIVFEQFKGTRSRLSTRLGGILTAGWRPIERHTLSLRAFVSRNSADDTRIEAGTDATGDPTIQSRLQYVADELAYGQMSGEHGFGWVQVDWRSILARTTRDEPDTRYLTYFRSVNDPPGTPYRFSDAALGGSRISNETREDVTDSNLDITIPYDLQTPDFGWGSSILSKFKTGAAYSFRDRSFGQRRFEYLPDDAGVDVTQPPEVILAPENIGPGSVNFAEATDPEDQFKGTHEIIGGYGMFDLPLVKDRLRIIGGARVEYSRIHLDSTFLSSTLCPPGEQTCTVTSLTQKEVNALPSLSLIANPTKQMNLRFSWSQTVARPELRELSPATYLAQRGEPAFIGNPALVQYGITNWDARWEWFFSPLEIASVGVFYKELQAPIEMFQWPRGGQRVVSPFNVQKETLLGVEVEGKKNLGFFGPKFREFGIAINGSWLDSSVEVPKQLNIQGLDLIPFTQGKRVAQGTPPWIVGASIEYANTDWATARLEWSTSGRTLDSAGTNDILDTFEEPRDRLNFALSVPLKRYLGGTPVSVKLSVENILNDQVRFTRTDIPGATGTVPSTVRRYTDGVTFGLSFSLTH